MSAKDLCIEALSLWILGAKLQQAIERDEYKRLDSLHRMIVTRNGLLANLIALCRQNPRLDSRPAILALIAFFSDNDANLCTLTIRRIAQLLSRDERNVRESVAWLEGQGVIGINRTANGLPNSYWPRVSHGLLDSKASIAWFTEAFSFAPGKPGRPKNTPDVDDRGFSGNTPDMNIRGFSENTPDVEAQYPGCRGTNTPDVEAHREFTKSNSLLNSLSAQQAAPDAHEAAPELPLASQMATEPRAADVDSAAATGATVANTAVRCARAQSGGGRPRQRKAAPVEYTAKLTEAWLAFPDRAGMSKSAAAQSWVNQGCEAIADTVIAGVKAYATDIGQKRKVRPDTAVKHMQGWISERRWESFETEQEAPEAAERSTEQRKVLAVAMDLNENEQPNRIREWWQSFADVPRQILVAGAEHAKREFLWRPSSAFALHSCGEGGRAA